MSDSERPCWYYGDDGSCKAEEFLGFIGHVATKSGQCNLPGLMIEYGEHADIVGLD